VSFVGIWMVGMLMVPHVEPARELVRMNQVDRARADRGLAPIDHDEQLRDLARYHSADVALSGSAAAALTRVANEVAQAEHVAPRLVKVGEGALSDPQVNRGAVGVVVVGEQEIVTEIGIIDPSAAHPRQSWLRLLDDLWSTLQHPAVDALYVSL
jgi:hypothetical protein